LPKINKLNHRNEKNYFILITFLSVVGHAQVTSSAMSGAIKSTTGEMLPGASVEVLQAYWNKVLFYNRC
jgi:hypothetical protein